MSALRDGANVVLAARRKDELAKRGGRARPQRRAHRPPATDITDPDSCASLVQLAQERFGSVDALIQVAAFEHAWGGLYDLKLDDWRAAFDTNVLGALTASAAGGQGHEGGWWWLGRASSARSPCSSRRCRRPATPPRRALCLTAIYYLADELGPDNIRCNMVIPSWMWGPNVQLYVSGTARRQGRSEEEVLEELVGDFPLRRMTEDGEVADVAVFFASDHAKAVTGQYLLVNAGELLR